MSGAALYAATQGQNQNALVEQHAPLVKRIAHHLMNRLPPSVQVDDLIQSGMIGLIEAARNYDASQGASFETYAGIRIRGSMLDEIRRTDWTPRSVHRKARQVAEAVHQIEAEAGRDARANEVAERLGLSMTEYHKILQDASSARIFSLDEPLDDSSSDSGTLADMVEDRGDNDPLGLLEDDGFRDGLAESIRGLPERERMVMGMYYDQALNLREIGEVLGVSESRVCQIHGQAMIRLRARMRDWLEH